MANKHSYGISFIISDQLAGMANYVLVIKVMRSTDLIAMIRRSKNVSLSTSEQDDILTCTGYQPET